MMAWQGTRQLLKHIPPDCRDMDTGFQDSRAQPAHSSALQFRLSPRKLDGATVGSASERLFVLLPPSVEAPENVIILKLGAVRGERHWRNRKGPLRPDEGCGKRRLPLCCTNRNEKTRWPEITCIPESI